MSHFAKVVSSKVVNVIVAEPEFFETFVDDSPGEWVQTSYNSNFRGMFACIGCSYDPVRDVFFWPEPT